MSDQAASTPAAARAASTLPFVRPKLYDHWSKVNAVAFRERWPNFSPAEIACRGSGAVLIDPAALDKLQLLRSAIGKPLIVTSGYRSPAHNKAEGGEPGSLHLEGRAFDIAIANHDPTRLEDAARRFGFGGIGRYPNNGFIHIDTGRVRWWGAKEWPASTRVPFQPPPPPVRERIEESRTVKGAGVVSLGGVAAVATAAASAIEPIRPVLDWMRSNPTGTLWTIGLVCILVGLYFGALRADDWRRKRR